MEESEDEIIRRDKEMYPNCHHSTSIQKFFSFSSEAGRSNDSIKTILRICPGQQPVPIYKKSSNNSGGDNDDFERGLGGFNFGGLGGHDTFDSLIDSFFGNSFFGPRTGRREGNFGGFGDPFAEPSLGGGFGRERRQIPNPNTKGNDSFQRDWSPSVLQPPHSLPKGTSPSISSGQSPSKLQGEAVSPPENI